MRKGKMKRWTSVICVLLTMVMILSACGGSDSGSGSSGDTGSEDASAGSENTDTGSDESTEATDDAGAEAADNGGWHVEENTLPIANGDVELTIYCGFAGGARHEVSRLRRAYSFPNRTCTLQRIRLSLSL